MPDIKQRPADQVLNVCKKLNIMSANIFKNVRTRQKSN